MVFSKLSLALIAIATPTLVSSQTYTSCNPLTTTCSPDPAFGNHIVHCHFVNGACPAFQNVAGTNIQYGANGAVFEIASLGVAPTIETGKYIFFGRVDIEVQAAPGQGIVTSAVLQSDDLDEIDLEWIGSDNTQVQSNYFSKGDTSTYDRGEFHPVENPVGSFHTYTIEWTSQAINWLIDGQVVRTLTPADAGSYGYPQSPMQIKLGTWVAGSPDAAEGTIQWAGGLADFSQGPFLAYYKSISIVDYAGGDSPTSKSVKEYIYGGMSGTWQSIQVVS